MSRRLIYSGNISCTLPLRTLVLQNPVHPNRCVDSPSSRICLRRILRCRNANHPHLCSWIAWCASFLCCTAWYDGCTMDGTILLPGICTLNPRMASGFRWLDSHPHESWICNWRSLGWCLAHQESRKLLAVCLLSPTIYFTDIIAAQAYFHICSSHARLSCYPRLQTRTHQRMFTC